MTPLEYEPHWEKVWNYLMLGCIKPLKQDLCFPLDIDQMQSSLREAFEDHYRTNEFNLASGPLMLRMTAQLRSSFTETNILRVFAWGDYLSDFVHSRVGEFVWTSTLFGLDEAEHAEWLVPKFLSMQSRWQRSIEQIDTKLGMLRFTDSDRELRERLELTEEDLVTHLTLILHYNVFARVWHESMAGATLQELEDVYACGKGLALARGIEETQIPYPGMWEVGPQRTLLGIESI